MCPEVMIATIGLEIERSRAGSSSALTTKLELILGRPKFNSSVMHLDCRLVCLLPIRIFRPVSVLCLFHIFVCFSLSGMPVNYARCTLAH